MKKTALGVVALAGTVFVQLAGAAPSTASERADVTKTVTRGQGLTAEFDRADGCIRTMVSVFGSVFTFSGTPTPDKLGFVSVTQENTCTGATLINGFGETESLNLDVSSGLSNGRLRMSMEFTNFADPDNPVVSPMTADVSFRATAHAATTSTKSKSRAEGTRFESSEDTRSRPASVGGTVKLGAQSVVSRSNSSSSATVGSVLTKEKTEAR